MCCKSDVFSADLDSLDVRRCGICACFLFQQNTAYEMRISDWEFRRVLFRSNRFTSYQHEVNHIKGASPGGADAKGLGGGVSKGEAGSRSAYQLPVFCIDAQGSFGGSDSPFCSRDLKSVV